MSSLQWNFVHIYWHALQGFYSLRKHCLIGTGISICETDLSLQYFLHVKRCVLVNRGPGALMQNKYAKLNSKFFTKRLHNRNLSFGDVTMIHVHVDVKKILHRGLIQVLPVITASANAGHRCIPHNGCDAEQWCSSMWNKQSRCRWFEISWRQCDVILSAEIVHASVSLSLHTYFDQANSLFICIPHAVIF